jgi:hypothetical protein
VSDDASEWTVHQSYTGRSKGYYKDSNGVLQSFDDSLNVSDDGPSSSFLQQPSGQEKIYWIDGPGYRYTRSGYSIDSMTQVQNFTTQFCSTTTQNDCSSTNWYVKLVVKSGGVLDTTNSQANTGSASTNF